MSYVIIYKDDNYRTTFTEVATDKEAVEEARKHSGSVIIKAQDLKLEEE